MNVDSQILYRVQKEDLPKLRELLTASFAGDPLYHSLIPDAATRNRLLPELFECDLWEFFKTCEIFADSRDLNGILVVSDESEPYNPFQFYLTELRAQLKTDEHLIREDMSMKTFWNFLLGRDYLNSRWTDQLHQENRLHIIYLAVRPAMQRTSHRGGHPLCRGTPDDDFLRDPQRKECEPVPAFRLQDLRDRGKAPFSSEAVLHDQRNLIKK